MIFIVVHRNPNQIALAAFSALCVCSPSTLERLACLNLTISTKKKKKIENTKYGIRDKNKNNMIYQIV